MAMDGHSRKSPRSGKERQPECRLLRRIKMKEKLSRRLMRLEEIHVAAVRAKEAGFQSGVPSAAEILRERLRAHGFEQTGNESLAETTARAFGMSTRELGRYLEERAARGNAA
jgi:hypothetical protein